MSRLADPGLGEETAWGQWRVAWHGFFYLLLVYATGSALSAGPLSAVAITVRLLLAAALGGWYWVWLLGSLRRSRHAFRVYLLGAAALWAVLTVVDGDFLILGFAVFAPFCLHHLGVALVLTLMVIGGLAWQWLAGSGGVPWPSVGAVLLLATGGLLMTGTVGAIVRQSRERQRLLEQLQATRAELAAAERQAGILQERQRLARDIHDTLTQGFASVVMLLEAAEESLATGRQAGPHIQQALRSARDNLADSRRVVWALRPRALAERPLPEALERLSGQLAEETAIRAEVVVTGTVGPLSAEVEETLLRVAQEALANVRKHAAASHVTITVSYLNDVVMLDVQDDGVGFDPTDTASTPGGLGMQDMRERVEELGGSLTVESAAGEGTTIAAELPAAARPDGHQVAVTGSNAQ